MSEERLTKIMRVLFRVCGCFIIVAGALLLLATPAGLFFILLGALYIFGAKRYVYKKREKKSWKEVWKEVQMERMHGKTQETKLTPVPETVKNFHVTGTSYYKNNAEQILVENPAYEYSKRELEECWYVDGPEFEYELEFLNRVSLVAEPDNEYDPNAVRVDIYGKTVGYIKRGSCTQVKNLLASDDFIRCEVSDFRYGRYKELVYDYETDSYRIEKGRFDNPSITVSIYSRQKESPE